MSEDVFGYPSMGPGVGVDIDPAQVERRTGTLSALDFAHWAAQNVEPIPAYQKIPESTIDSLTGVELVLYAAEQVGVAVPETSTVAEIASWVSGTTTTVSEALRTRGALLVGDSRVAVTLGFDWIIESRGDRYLFTKVIETNSWLYGALVPGVNYR